MSKKSETLPETPEGEVTQSEEKVVTMALPTPPGPPVSKNIKKVQMLTAKGGDSLPPGTVLVICASPGFRRAGIEHKRTTLWARGELTDEQIEAMRREPLLTLIEVI